MANRPTPTPDPDRRAYDDEEPELPADRDAPGRSLVEDEGDAVEPNEPA